MSFLRCNIHITRPGNLYDLNVESFGSMARFSLKDNKNSFSIGSGDDDYINIADLTPHHIECRIIFPSTLEIKTKDSIQFILADNRKFDITADSPIKIPFILNEQHIFFRFKILVGKSIIRGEILSEAEVLPPKFQKYLEIQYGRFEKIQEGRSCLIFLTKKEPRVIKLLRPSFGKVRGVLLRFINAARRFCVLPDHLFLPIQEIVYRREFPLSYVIMQNFPGESLENYLARRGILSPQESIYITRSLAQNLMVLKDHEYCCRNLTPENVMIDENQRVRLTGFFLLKSQEHNVTVPGAQMIIPKYTAPEQIDNPITADIYADIFSLGAIFHHALVGEPPYNFNHAKEYIKALKYNKGICGEEIQKKAPYLSNELCNLVARMLSFDKKDRPSPEQLLGHLSDHSLANVPQESAAEEVWAAGRVVSPQEQDMFEEDYEAEKSPFVAKDDSPTIRYHPGDKYPKMLSNVLNMSEQVSNDVENNISVSPPSKVQSESSATDEIIVATPVESNSSENTVNEAIGVESASSEHSEALSAESASSENTVREAIVVESESSASEAMVIEPNSAEDDNDDAIVEGFAASEEQKLNLLSKSNTFHVSSESIEFQEESVNQDAELLQESFSLEESKLEKSASFSALLEVDQELNERLQTKGEHSYTLKVVRGPENSRQLEYHFRKDQQVVIGREADFCIRTDTLISRAHARLEYIANDWWLTDLRSRNGVYISNKKISRQKIVPGTEFTIGETTIRFQKNTSLSQIFEEQDISEEAMDSIREIRITRMYSVCKQEDNSAISSTPSIVKPLGARLSESNLWQKPNKLDEADQAMEAVYQEFQQTSIVEKGRKSSLVDFNKGKITKAQKVVLVLILLLFAIGIITISFIYFLEKM